MARSLLLSLSAGYEVLVSQFHSFSEVTMTGLLNPYSMTREQMRAILFQEDLKRVNLIGHWNNDTGCNSDED